MSYFHFPDNLDGCIEEEEKKINHHTRVWKIMAPIWNIFYEDNQFLQ